LTRFFSGIGYFHIYSNTQVAYFAQHWQFVHVKYDSFKLRIMRRWNFYRRNVKFIGQFERNGNEKQWNLETGMGITLLEWERMETKNLLL